MALTQEQKIAIGTVAAVFFGASVFGLMAAPPKAAPPNPTSPSVEKQVDSLTQTSTGGADTGLGGIFGQALFGGQKQILKIPVCATINLSVFPTKVELAA